jgi:release factor glutamine methyltransferase
VKIMLTETDVASTLRTAGCVFAEDEARVLLSAARDGADLDTMIARRVAGDPLEQIVGFADFCGLRIALDPGVFVPRRRTEFLVAQGVALAPPRPVIVDLCCGSGAVATALSAQLSPMRVYAVDVDESAVKCARRNVPGEVYHGDLYEPLPTDLRGRIDLLVANAPYVPTDAIDLMPPEARLHEPIAALDGGADGLDVARAVVAGAGEWLNAVGQLLIETSAEQAPTLMDIMGAAGLTAWTATDEELGATVVIGRTAY